MASKLYPYRHFILYIKGHYHESNDKVNDLMKVICNYTGNDRSHKKYVLGFLETIVNLLQEMNPNVNYVKKLMNDMTEFDNLYSDPLHCTQPKPAYDAYLYALTRLIRDTTITELQHDGTWTTDKDLMEKLKN